MSVISRIIAGLASRKRAEFVSFSANWTTGFGPTGLLGDLMVVAYYSGRSITGGGAGASWQTDTFGQLSVSSRQIMAGDLGGTINFNSDTPYVLSVFRGPTKLSARKTSLNASLGGDLPGFTPSANALGIYVAGTATNEPPVFQITPPSQLENERTQGTSGGLGVTGGHLVGIEGYIGGAFAVAASAGVVNAASYELQI